MRGPRGRERPVSVVINIGAVTKVLSVIGWNHVLVGSFVMCSLCRWPEKCIVSGIYRQNFLHVFFNPL
jgi:hypothetical protein